jgi:predicted TIM-barrel fold metal-dependent hydrolase
MAVPAMVDQALPDQPWVARPLVDHHCHGVVLQDVDRAEFEGMLNEAPRPSPLGTTLFDSMLGLAVRRWCAPVLDLEPHAQPEPYLRRRHELGHGEVTRRFLEAAGISDFVVDTGLAPGSICGPEELAAYGGGRAHEVVRLEALAEALLADGVPPEDFAEQLTERLSARPVVGAKSIAAYRVGLSLPDRKPGADRLTEAVRQARAGAGGRYRLADPVVSAWLAWTAIEVGLPLQFHVGYGDSDLDLDACDPLRLTAFLRATQEHGVPVLLLHNYPFHRGAAYLAQVFDHVFMDLGLTTHNCGAFSVAPIRESLELVPFGKMLYSSDAYGLAELYFLGAHLFRRGLSTVLGSLVHSGEMTGDDAERVAELIGSANARRVYRLGRDGSA